MQGHAILSEQGWLTQRVPGWTPTIIACLSTLVLFDLSQPAAAEDSAVRILAPPPVAQILRIAPNGTTSATPSLSNLNAIVREPLGLSSSGEVGLDLDITYTKSTIYNPATNRSDAVRLRSYRDARETTPPKVPFVAPTIEINPGDTVRLTLNNKLPADDPSCPGTPGKPDIPHCFNQTNLHSHGLWVSPAGNSDNVLVDIAPGVTFQYEYNVPLDHPSGTFWYHPHLHGSTALQVSSGMAGILLVKGNRLPTPQSTGDIDTLLHEANGAPVPERLLLLQQIQYACNGAYDCKPGEIGTIWSGNLGRIGALHDRQRRSTADISRCASWPDRALAFCPCRRARYREIAIAQDENRRTALCGAKRQRPGFMGRRELSWHTSVSIRDRCRWADSLADQ